MDMRSNGKKGAPEGFLGVRIGKPSGWGRETLR